MFSIRLPRVNEISTEVDNDPRAAYFSSGSVRRIRAHGINFTLLEIHVD